VTEMFAFNVRWEGSDNLSGLICAYQKADIRISDDGGSLNLHSAVKLGRPGYARIRWEGPDMRIPDGKALRRAPQMGKHGQPVDKLGSR